METAKSAVLMIIWLIFGFGFYIGYTVKGCVVHHEPETHAVAQFARDVVQDAASQPPAFPEVPYDAGAPRVRSRSKTHH